MIEQLLEYNREFVKSGAYEKFQTSKYPDKKIAILTCTSSVHSSPAERVGHRLQADLRTLGLVRPGASMETWRTPSVTRVQVCAPAQIWVVPRK